MNYQQSKKEYLEKILDEYCSNIEWIWIGNKSRRRVTFQIDRKNHLGFFAEKTHNLIEIDNDDSIEQRISDLIFPLKNFLKKQEENFYTQVCITLFDNGLDVVFSTKRTPNFAQIQQLISLAKENDLNISYREQEAINSVFIIRKNQIFFPDFKIDLNSDVFLQATKSGLKNIIKIIRSLFEKEEQKLKVADIYAGFGAYSFAIYDLVKSVSAFEGDKKMIDLLK